MTPRFNHILFNIRAYSCGLALMSLVIAPLSSLGQENSYSCKDRYGKPSFGNGPPGNECVSDICTFINGFKKCHSDPAPEPDEKSRNPQAEKDHQQFLSDIALLDRYASEEQIETDRKANLQPVLKSIADGKRRLKTALDQREGELQSELDFYPHGDIPPALAEKLRINSQAQVEAKREIKNGEVDERRINARYDDYVSRFLKLKEKAQKH